MSAALSETIMDAMAHLGAAKSQILPEDDQIICGHVRDAYAILSAALRFARAEEAAVAAKYPEARAA